MNKDELKCKTCNQFLSQFPIYLTKLGNVCGRCEKPKNGVHNRLFQQVAEKILFPCKYNAAGCIKKFQPKETRKHEETCKYRNLKCPFNEKCPTEITSQNFVSHFRKIHSIFLKGNTNFQIDISKTTYIRRFVLINNSLLRFQGVINRKSRTLNYELQLYFIGEEETGKRYYELVINNGTRQTSVKDEINSLVKEDLKLQIKENLITISFNVTEEKKLRKSEDLLGILTCNLCRKHLEVNADCFYTSEENIVCEMCLGDAPDLRMEGSTVNLFVRTIFLCGNSDCTYADTLLRLPQHKKCCFFRMVICPFQNSCHWQGVRHNLQQHISETHPRSFVKFDTFSVKLHERNMRTYVIKMGTNLFVLNYCMWDNEIFKWQLYPIDEGEAMFKYEIEFNEEESYLKLTECNATLLWESLNVKQISATIMASIKFKIKI